MLLAIGGRYHGELVDWPTKHLVWFIPEENINKVYADEPIDPVGQEVRKSYYNLTKCTFFGQVMWVWVHENYNPLADPKPFGFVLMKTIINNLGKQAFAGSESV